MAGRSTVDLAYSTGSAYYEMKRGKQRLTVPGRTEPGHCIDVGADEHLVQLRDDLRPSLEHGAYLVCAEWAWGVSWRVEIIDLLIEQHVNRFARPRIRDLLCYIHAQF